MNPLEVHMMYRSHLFEYARRHKKNGFTSENNYVLDLFLDYASIVTTPREIFTLLIEDVNKNGKPTLERAIEVLRSVKEKYPTVNWSREVPSYDD